VPRIYADFNALLDPGGPYGPGLVHLERLGTLRDLCAARVRLSDGLALQLYSDSSATEELEIDAVARWIEVPGIVRGGCWVGEFGRAAFRDVPARATRAISDWFPCGACGVNLAAEIQKSGLNGESRCGACGVRVHAMIDPPYGDA